RPRRAHRPRQLRRRHRRQPGRPTRRLHAHADHSLSAPDFHSRQSVVVCGPNLEVAMHRSCRLLLVPLLAACSPTESTHLEAPLLASPRWGTSERYVGSVAPEERITIQVHLKLHDQQEAEQLLTAISDPQSPRYRHYLSQAEFESRFAPRPEDIAAVRAHLE